MELRPLETAGYRISAQVPCGVEEEGETRDPYPADASGLRVLKLFRCHSPGEYHIGFLDKRPWESVGERSVVTITCLE